MARNPERLVLIGGGHAHVAVVADWIANGPICDLPILITPSRYLRYSGMVPGWIAGQYGASDGLVDLAALAARAGAELMLDTCCGLDLIGKSVLTEGGHDVPFDVLSIDAGGTGRSDRLLKGVRDVLDVRPIDRFVAQLEGIRTAAPLRHVAVIGGGAAGVELAFAFRNMAQQAATPGVTLVSGKPGLVPQMSASVRTKVTAELARQGITLVQDDARTVGGQIRIGGEAGNRAFDLVVAALGSDAPQWPAASGVACTDDGFIMVESFQNSISHDNVFAVGDIAERQDRVVAHSGVHAVMAGPVLAANLRQVMAGEKANRSYRPRRHSLYLISTGNGSAIASYGPFAAQGRMVAALKHWIDKRWITKYARLAAGE